MQAVAGKKVTTVEGLSADGSHPRIVPQLDRLPRSADFPL
jgi:hypothetical protein